jgi:anti-sigma regulatory factor (Ser/Thr protein kinase)
VIPPVRKFISEALQVSGFSTKFAFRTEIIVDAICNNAIAYGSAGNADSEVSVSCEICADCVEIAVKDRGGSAANVERLREAIRRSRLESPTKELEEDTGMGLEIVKLLSEAIELSVDENNLTSINVISRREDG